MYLPHLEVKSYLTADFLEILVKVFKALSFFTVGSQGMLRTAR